jgi:hypothetical protein
VTVVEFRERGNNLAVCLDFQGGILFFLPRLLNISYLNWGNTCSMAETAVVELEMA